MLRQLYRRIVNRLSTTPNCPPCHKTVRTRIQQREQEITRVMALKIEEEATALLAEGLSEQDVSKQVNAMSMLTRAQHVREGEASLLSAMGLLQPERNTNT